MKGRPVAQRRGDRELELFRRLVGIASPSGREQELGREVASIAEEMGHRVERDGAGNLTVRLPGTLREARPVMYAAHQDEISLVVTWIGPDGALWVDRCGGLLPYKIGECPVEVLGDRRSVTGILSMGSAHREDA